MAGSSPATARSGGGARTDGVTRHSFATEMAFAPSDPGLHPRHVNSIWPVWNVFDLTPEGRGTDWYPALSYR